MPDDFGAERIGLDVPHNGQVIGIVLNREAFVASLVEMADTDRAVSGVKALDMRQRNPSHERRQVAVAAGPQNQVPVVAHQAPAAKPHLIQRNAFRQDLLERFKVGGLLAYSQPPVGTVENMIDIPAMRDALRSAHNYRK